MLIVSGHAIFSLPFQCSSQATPAIPATLYKITGWIFVKNRIYITCFLLFMVGEEEGFCLLLKIRVRFAGGCCLGSCHSFTLLASPRVCSPSLALNEFLRSDLDCCLCLQIIFHNDSSSLSLSHTDEVKYIFYCHVQDPLKPFPSSGLG